MSLRPKFAALARRVEGRAEAAALAGAGALADEIRRECPVETGALRASIAVESLGKTPSGAAAAVAIPLDGGHPEDDTNLFLHVEFGTEHTPADPFARRGARLGRRAAVAAALGRLRAAVR